MGALIQFVGALVAASIMAVAVFCRTGNLWVAKLSALAAFVVVIIV